jgi:hypothetical protein
MLYTLKVNVQMQIWHLDRQTWVLDISEFSLLLHGTEFDVVLHGPRKKKI